MFQLSCLILLLFSFETLENPVGVSGLMAQGLCFAEEETEARQLRSSPGLGLEQKSPTQNSLSRAKSWKNQLIQS